MHRTLTVRAKAIALAGGVLMGALTACKESLSPELTERLAFVRTVGSIGKIHVMGPDGSGVTPVRLSNDGEFYPAWSPDGRMIAFLRSVDTLGSTDYFVGIYTMRDDGSQLTRVYSPSPSTTSPPCDNCSYQLFHLTWSPDGSRLAFDSHLDGFWVPETRNLYLPQRIYTVRLDGSELTRTNPVMDSLMLPDWYPAWSPDGGKIAFASYRAFSWLFAPGANGDIYVMNPDGSGLIRLTDHPFEEAYPAWSPDGRRLAFERRPDQPPYGADIFLMNADGSEIVQLTHGPGTNFHPSWSPDGTRIAFSSDRDGNWEIYVINVDGTGLTRLTNHPTDDYFPKWAPRRPEP